MITFTKRPFLSKVATLFDPPVFLASFIVRTKCYCKTYGLKGLIRMIPLEDPWPAEVADGLKNYSSNINSKINP